MTEPLLGAPPKRLTPEDIEALPAIWARQLAGDKEAERYLTDAYLWLARKHAFDKSIPQHIEREELISWASKGLLEAIRRFDPSTSDGALHKHFMAYASRRIRGAILDGIKSPQTSWAPRSAWRQIKEQRETEDLLSQELGRLPSRQQVADRMGISTDKFLVLQQQIPIGATSEGEEYGMEVLAGSDVPDEEVALDALATRVATCLAGLPRQGQVVLERTLLQRLSLGAVSRELGMAIPQVRTLHAESLLALRLALRGSRFQ